MTYILSAITWLFLIVSLVIVLKGRKTLESDPTRALKYTRVAIFGFAIAAIAATINLSVAIK